MNPRPEQQIARRTAGHAAQRARHDLGAVPGQLNRAIAAYLTLFTGASRDHARSDLRAFLSWCAERHLDPLAGASPAPGVVHPVDAADPPLQALHGLAPLMPLSECVARTRRGGFATPPGHSAC